MSTEEVMTADHAPHDDEPDDHVSTEKEQS